MAHHAERARLGLDAGFKRVTVDQGVWFEMSLDGGGVEDELDGRGRVALVDLEPTR